MDRRVNISSVFAFMNNNHLTIKLQNYNLNVLEDEFHFCLVCPAYRYQRHKLIPSYYRDNPTASKLHSLLTNNNICNFLLPNLCIYYSVSERPPWTNFVNCNVYSMGQWPTEKKINAGQCLPQVAWSKEPIMLLRKHCRTSRLVKNCPFCIVT